MNSPPFIFAIPFKSKAAANDWEKNNMLLASTLRSVLGQSNQDFQVVIACHEAPEIPEIYDERITILRAETAPPKDLREQMRDKGHKRKVMTVEWRLRGGGYLMLLDADDLVSRHLVEYVRDNPSETGYLIKHGYCYNVHSASCKPLSEFNKVCGSCTIFRMEPDDLPEAIDDNTPRLIGEFKNHTTFEADAKRIGREFRVVPFPAAIWVIGHGENYLSRVSPPGIKKYLYQVQGFMNKSIGRHQMSDAIRDEFKFSESVYSSRITGQAHSPLR